MQFDDGTNSDTTNNEDAPAMRLPSFDHVEVTCEAILGRSRTTIGELDRLTQGEAIRLDTSPADLAEVRLNGKTIARGEIVVMDEVFAIRLTEIV